MLMMSTVTTANVDVMRVLGLCDKCNHNVLDVGWDDCLKCECVCHPAAFYGLDVGGYRRIYREHSEIKARV